jgi:hypothetical protein
MEFNESKESNIGIFIACMVGYWFAVWLVLTIGTAMAPVAYTINGMPCR